MLPIVTILRYLISHGASPLGTYVGLARTIYKRFVYGIFGREITKYTVIYGVYIRFWPALHTYVIRDEVEHAFFPPCTL